MLKTRWETIRDEVAEMLADGVPLEDITGKLEKLKNEYQKQLTNEEYIRQCNTEQLAELITDIIYECRDCDDCMDCRLGWCSKDYVVGWLKEKHE